MGILNHKYRDEKYARRLLIAGLAKLPIVSEPFEHESCDIISLKRYE